MTLKTSLTRNIARRLLAGFALAGLLLMTVSVRPAQAGSTSQALHPDVQRIKSDAHRLGKDVGHGASTLGHQIRRDTRQANRQLHQQLEPKWHRARHELRDDMHRLGRQFHGWWSHLKARLAREHSGSSSGRRRNA
jgi:hypothetical protein